MTNDNNDETDESGLEDKHTRRKVLATAAGIAAGGAVGHYAGSRPVVGATTAGSTVASRTTPAEAIFADRLRLVDNNQSLTDNGDFRYNP